MKIVANVICFNSQPELPALLESLKGRVDGLAAVDGGSRDESVEVLQRWGAENGIPVTVRQNIWPDDFALQRNICLNITRAEYGISGDSELWVLAIDTDDTLVEFDRVFIEASVGSEGVGGMMCRMDNGNGFFHVCQFFRLTAGAVWKNPIHEYAVLNGDRVKLVRVGKLTIKRGRSAQHDCDPMRNVRIGRRFVEDNPANERARFYLGRDICECGEMPPCQRRAEAEGHLRAYLAMRCGYVAQDRYARLLLVKLLSESGRALEARRLMLDSIAEDPDNKSAYDALSRLSDAKAESDVWRRLAATATGGCILPYGAKLPARKEA